MPVIFASVIPDPICQTAKTMNAKINNPNPTTLIQIETGVFGLKTGGDAFFTPANYHSFPCGQVEFLKPKRAASKRAKFFPRDKSLRPENHRHIFAIPFTAG
ncbi:MAG: hypothetical protein ACKO6B_05880 [Planctomycetia bacterium]